MSGTGSPGAGTQTSLALVLADRSVMVADALSRQYPRLRAGEQQPQHLAAGRYGRFAISSPTAIARPV